jgi:uncharacterized membrane protein
MDIVHLHLLISHVPVLATFFSLAILVWAMISKHPEHYKIAFAGFIVAGIFAVLAFLTGEGAEDIAETIAGITEANIERHEDAASLALWMTVVLGVFGIAGLIWNKIRVKGFRPFVWTVFFYGLVTAGVLAYTANLGGQIRHTEITETTQIQQEYLFSENNMLARKKIPNDKA